MMIDNEALIAEVQHRPALWDMRHPHRHNREVLEVLWDDVARPFGASRDDVRKKWKGLRDTFRKELRKFPNGLTDTTPGAAPTWVFFKHLYFLKDQMRPMKEKDASATAWMQNIEKGEVNSDDDATDPVECESTLENPGLRSLRRPGEEMIVMDKKRYRDLMHQEDEDYHFFMSLLPHVRMLDPLRKLQVRQKLQDLVIKEVYGTGDDTSGAFNNHDAQML